MSAGVRGSSVVVGIATRNRADILPKAIASARAQAYPNRIFVIDDASTDHTPALRDKYPDVTWERFESRQGYVRARNRIIFTAPEDYYVSLDDDAWFVQDDEITLAVDLLDRHPNVAAVAFDIVGPDRPRSEGRVATALVPMFIGCGHVLRRSAVKRIGGYTEFPGTYGVEEKDLCLRLIDAGYEIVLLQGVDVWHDRTATARDHAYQRASSVCNDLAFALGRVPLPHLLPTLIYKTAINFKYAVGDRSVGLFLKGFANFLSAAKGVWRRRIPVRMESLSRFQDLSKAPQKFSG